MVKNGTIKITSNGIVRNIIRNGTTSIHTFTSNSGVNTIKFNSNTMCDILLVGGGGA